MVMMDGVSLGRNSMTFCSRQSRVLISRRRDGKQCGRSSGGEERRVHCKKEEGSHRKKAAEEEVNIGGLWEDDAMVAMDDDEGDDSELETFQVTKIGMV